MKSEDQKTTRQRKKKEKITPAKKASRKYERTHKEERKEATGQFNTRLPRRDFDEINDFLEEYHIRKIDLIYAGYHALMMQKLGKKVVLDRFEKLMRGEMEAEHEETEERE